MCGIFSVFNNSYDKTLIEKSFQLGKSRGPEHSSIKYLSNSNVVMGFHRLSINGWDPIDTDDSILKSTQPFFVDGCYLICNGEIYNWQYLISKLNIQLNTKSDCEIIIHLYKKFGIKNTLELLDGVFAFVLYDTKNYKMFVARDQFGLRPLYHSIQNKGGVFKTYVFASLMKQISNMNDSGNIYQFEPGTYSEYYVISNVISPKFENKYFVTIPNTITNYAVDLEILNSIYLSLENAVNKRINNTDRPITCLLSGGLDSSIITALVKKNYKGELHTWSIGLEGSEDLKYAELVANHLKTKHHSIVVTEKEFLDAIPQVIYDIESYDTTSVRASVGNWMVAKYIKENSDCKVVFNGDGSDELTGGYLYFHKSPNEISFDFECKRLLKDIHYFDVLRSDRSISCHGLEARTPFLDKSFVNTYLNIPVHKRFHSLENNPEKFLLRKAFDRDNLLPREVLWRTKEAFSDGVSTQSNSWHRIIQNHIENVIYKNKKIDFNKYENKPNPPTTPEQYYYREIFESHFNNQGSVIPYFWMPKFVQSNDASARELNIYNDLNKDKSSANSTYDSMGIYGC